SFKFMRLFIILLFLLITNLSQGQNRKFVKIISNLSDNDSISFSVTHIDCIAGRDIDAVPDFFILKKKKGEYTLSYNHYKSNLVVTLLNSNQVSFFKELELSQNKTHSTSCDNYVVIKGKQSREFNASYFYADTLRSFFTNTKK
ncbi:MAG TPA: hypothetical protein VKG26_01270, partial [Bacteroidia bacterium]|nr:hypothetical protein [Bacteroidia bacterium]